MTDIDALDRRLAAVERALVDGDRDPTDLPEAAAVADDIDALRESVDEIEARVAELEGATQALRGYVGNVRSVNDAVTDRADAAVATVDRLEYRLDELEERLESDVPETRGEGDSSGDALDADSLECDRIEDASDPTDGNRFADPAGTETRSRSRNALSGATAGNDGVRTARSTDGGLALQFDEPEEGTASTTDRADDTGADEAGLVDSIRNLFP